MAAKKSNFYLTREELIREIVLSKKKFRESNQPRTPAECFTPKLTEYLQLMVNKYANKGQWRGYCQSSDSEALTMRGWLGIDDITTSDMILSYHDGHMIWSKIKSIYRGDYDGKMFHLTNRNMDALVTPGHKFLTDEGLKPVELLKEKDRIIVLGKGLNSNTASARYSDAFVELIGWVVTEGNYYKDKVRKYTRITLWQNEGEKAQRIRQCIRALEHIHAEGVDVKDGGNPCVVFHLRADLCNQVTGIIPDKILTMEFINALTPSQRELLITTMIDADGSTTKTGRREFGQCNRQHMDVFTALCAMSGYRTQVYETPPLGYGKKPFYKTVVFSARLNCAVVSSVDFHGGKNTGRMIGASKFSYPNEPTIDYKGRVWCPETEYGCFVARRNGTIFLTGNSYISDMKSDALLTLCQNAFKYNEEKYDNPFGYYTQIIKYCFITFLEKEEVIRDIKDSLWESIGMTPSYARQIRNEQLKDAPDQSSKGMKALKKDIEVITIKIEQLSTITGRLRGETDPDIDLDWEISEALGIEIRPYTSEIEATLSLFLKPPEYIIEYAVEIAGNTVDCLSVIDTSTNSRTKRVLPDTNEQTIVSSLCSIALSIRRDLLVKRLREISGYNLSNTRIPTAERMIPPTDEFADDTRMTAGDFLIPGAPKRKGRKKNASEA